MIWAPICSDCLQPIAEKTAVLMRNDLTADGYVLMHWACAARLAGLSTTSHARKMADVFTAGMDAERDVTATP